MSFFSFLYRYTAMSNPFSRLRARWASTPKPVEALKAPTEEELAADQKILDKSVADAVNAVLHSEEFTKAVATHLAQQIQPTIKTALDISAVEAKILASNEALAQRVNEIDTQTTTKIAELSALIGTHSTTTTDKISGVEEAVGAVKASVAGLETNVKAVQDQIATPDTSILSSHTAKLDSISASLQTVQEQSPAVYSSLSTQTSKLDALTAQLDSIRAELEATIKAADKNDDILAGLKTSNDLHVSHGTALAGIKIPSLADLEAKVDGISASVAELRGKDLSEILAGVKASNDSHATHTATISEIKTIVSKPAAVPEKTDLSGVEASIQKVIGEIDAQNATLSEIKTTVSVPAPVAEKTDLSSLEASLQKLTTEADGQTATLSEIKAVISTPAPPAEKTDLSGLETSVQKVLASLDSQSGAITDIKAAIAIPVPAAEKTDLTGLETSVGKVISALDAQSATLEASKSKLDTLSTTDVITEVKSVKALVEAIPTPTAATDNTELINEVKAVKVVAEETKRETEALIVLVKSNAETPTKEVDVKPASKLNGENGVKVEEVDVEAAPAA